LLAHVSALALVLVSVLASVPVSGLVASTAVASTSPRATLVFVPGVTGSRLENAEGRQLWGPGRRLLWPRDRGHEIALPLTAIDDGVRATDVLEAIRLAGITKEVYRPLARALEEAGYHRGDWQRPTPEADLYFFAYDWRRDNTTVAMALHELLERIAVTRNQPHVDLACQSNAARICRYLAKYGGSRLDEAESGAPVERSYVVDKVVLIGASNGGSLRQLHELDRGRRYLPVLGRYLSPETLFTIRPLFSDLPTYTNDLFVDQSGETVEVDLFDADTWIRYDWTVFSPKIERKLARFFARHPDSRFGNRETRVEYLRDRLAIALREQRLLEADAPDFGTPRYYLLANRTAATAHRAVLVERSKRQALGKDGAPRRGQARRKKRWKTLFADDRRVRRNPRLLALTAGDGDGHATVESQLALSAQERATVAAKVWIEGGHFEAIVEPATHRALVEILLEGGTEAP
jgi:hypothetical protein